VFHILLKAFRKTTVVFLLHVPVAVEVKSDQEW
jgi:hypothetical protein